MAKVYVPHRAHVPANALTMREIAERTHLTYDTVRHFHTRGCLPAAIVVECQCVRPAPMWEPDVIDRWQSRRRRNPRSTVALRGQLEPLPPRERTKRVALPARKSPGQGPFPSLEFLAEFEAWKARTR